METHRYIVGISGFNEFSFKDHVIVFRGFILAVDVIIIWEN